MSIYAKVVNPSQIALYSQVSISLSANETFDSGVVTPGAFGANNIISWNNYTIDTEFGHSWPNDAMYAMKAPAYLFTMSAYYQVHYPLQPSATCLLSIELYLRND